VTSPIVIFGAGGFGRDVVDLIRDINRPARQWDLLGFIDDDPALWGTELIDVPVLGGRDWFQTSDRVPHVALGLGSPSVKQRVVDTLRDRVAGFPALVHPSAIISEYAQIGEGVVVTAANILMSRSVIDDFAMLNLACTLGHDSYVGRYSSLSPATNVSGYVHIGEGCDLGTGVKIIPGIRIGEWSVVGAGAVVTKDIPSNATAVGVPAQVIKQRDLGWHLAPRTGS
jgi:sugar O-acyltransferase (sialic acid O-acetyltransferase NeuD family)